MTTPWLLSHLLLWAIALGALFLLLGTLRSLGSLQWRLDELEATRPVRKGREGLPPGQRAPDFTLPAAAGGKISLSEFTGQRVLLVFTQSGCGPCHTIAPELNRLHRTGEQQVLVVNRGEHHETQAWSEAIDASFPIVTQNDWEISSQYHVFATPYAFIIDEQGTIGGKGIASSRQYLRYLLEAAGKRREKQTVTAERDSAVNREPVTNSTATEIIYA